MTTLKESFARIDGASKPKIIGNNTFRYEHADGRTIVRLHTTDIIEHLPGDRVRLNTGGWKTVTTKARFNEHTPYRVYSDGKGGWEVSDANGLRTPFFDGMVLPDAFRTDEGASTAKEDAALRKRIKDFVLKTLPTGKPIPEPNNGDCWDCLMFDREEPVDTTSIGWRGAVKPVREHRSTEHLRSHIDEGYMHGTLIVNALRANGIPDAGIGLICYGPRPDYNRVRRVVRKYLQKRLGLTF